VVLHRLHQDVCLLLTARHHETACIPDTGVALVSITCSSSSSSTNPKLQRTAFGRRRAQPSATWDVPCQAGNVS
jgi:hypothetical protein